MKSLVPPLLALLVLSLLAEALVYLSFVPAYLFPPPSAVVQAGLEQKSELMWALLSTAKTTAMGLLLSSALGIAIALVFSLNRFLKQALLPFALFFQTVPIVALAPLLVIWFGFGENTVMASAMIVSLFPILANTLLGLESAPKNLHELFDMYHASPGQKLRKLLLPYAASYIFAGIRIGAGLSVIGAIVGEFVAGGGLGSLIDSARTQQRPDLVFAAIALSTVLGFVMVKIADFLLYIWNLKTGVDYA